MKNILYLHSGAELYGADQILLKILSNIDKNKFNPIVILPNEGPLTKKLIENNIRYIIIDYPVVRRKYFNIKGIFEYIITYKKACKKIIEICKKEKIDIIHSNTIAVLEGIYIHKKTKIPLISHIHEMIDHPKIIAKILYKITLNGSNKVIAVSDAVKKYIESLVNNKKNNITVIHNGIEDVEFEKVDTDYLYEELKIPRDSIIVTTIGRINAIKGQDDFVDVMTEVIRNNKSKNIYGLIVGDCFPGQEWRMKALENKIKSKAMDEKIRLLGFREDTANIEKIMDIYVLPSIRYDSFPTVVLEAMRMGKPVVAYKCGGVEEMIIDNENGFLINMSDKENLQLKINELVINQNKRDDFKIKTRQIFQSKFNINVFIKKIEGEYEC